MFLHYSYLNTNRTYGKNTVGWYSIKISDPTQADTISRRVDGLFKNSFHETKTASEKMLAKELMAQVLDFGLIVKIATAAVFITLIIVAANTMMHIINERTKDYAILKVLGAKNIFLSLGVFSESLIIIGLGAILGTLVSHVAIPKIASFSNVLTNMSIGPGDLIPVLVACVLISLLISILPVMHVLRIHTGSHLGRAA